jgi:hypothetical protein
VSFWDRFLSGQRAPSPLPDVVRRGEVEQIARSKEAHYRVMRRFAVEAGDEGSVRYYDERLNDLRLLQNELDVIIDRTENGEGA